MEQGVGREWQRITGKEWSIPATDSLATLEPHVGVCLIAFAPHKGDHRVPCWHQGAHTHKELDHHAPEPHSACYAVLCSTPGTPQEPWARCGRWRGALGSVLPVPAQNAVYSSCPPDLIVLSPDSRRAYVTLRGPKPAPTMPYATVGETPEEGVVDVASRTLLPIVK